MINLNHFKKAFICTLLFGLVLSTINTCFASNEIPEVVVIGDKSKQKLPSVLGDTTPKISDKDLADLQKKIDKMNEAEAAKACEQAVANGLCLGIKLNTNIPFVGNCIQTRKCGDNAATPVNAFPKLIGALMNLLMTIILIMSLLMIVWSGVLMTMSGVDASKYTKGVNLLKRVATGMALLGASGVILKVINPNFFI